MKSLKEYICPNPDPADINIDKLVDRFALTFSS